MEYQLLAVVLGAAGLHGVFRLIETSWPDKYMSLSDYASYRKSVHPVGYMLFRHGPVFAVSLFVAVSLDRGSQAVWLPVIVMLLIHASATHGRAALSVWPRTTDPRRSPLVALHVLTGLSLVAVGASAVLLRDRLAPLIPPLESLAGELWGAAIAASFVAYLYTQIKTRTVDTESMIRDVRNTIDPELVSLGRTLALEQDADPDLVEAIMVAEHLQRPPWFRRLERIKALAFPVGTYGIMQVRHRGAIDDRESIRLAVKDLLHGHKVPMTSSGDYEYIDRTRLEAELAAYNRSPLWLATVIEILEQIRWSRKQTG